jgi:hypothetical protein
MSLIENAARVCPTCGHPDTDRQDFCPSCGEYLRWDTAEERPPGPRPLAEAPAAPVARYEVGPEPPAAPVARYDVGPERPAAYHDAPFPAPAARGEARAAEAPASVLLELRAPGAGPGGPAPSVRVSAGGRALLTGLIRNQSGVVDNFDFRVAGLPAQWVALPPTAYLLPFGSGEGHEQALELTVAPPRAPEAEARAWPFALEAVSRTTGRVAARAEATLVIEPFQDVAVSARPQRRRGRVRATFDVDVVSRGNARLSVALAPADADDACLTHVEPPAVQVHPGGRATARLRVSPRRTLWWGRPVEHRIDVQATPPVAAPQVVYRQLPWIPWWVPVAVLAIVALVIALLALRGETIVTPDVRGQTVEQAQQILVEAGLESAPRVQEVVVQDASQVGRVLGQNPAAGTEIDADDAVLLQAGVANQVVAVPEVRGATRDQAQQLLSAAGLTLGVLEPADAPADAVVEFQNPAAGAQARLGASVDVILAVEEEEAEPTPEPAPEEAPAEPVEEAPAEPVEEVDPVESR